MIEYDAKVNLAHYPVPMGRYGQTPFGDNLFRIVRTDSRRRLVGGEWFGGERMYHWVPAYRNCDAAWILEMWRPEPMSPRQWSEMSDPVTGWPLFGPYPSRGDYELVFEFDSGVEADSLDNIVGTIAMKRQRSWQDDKDILEREYLADQKETSVNNYLDIRDGMTAFGSAAMSGGSHGRGTKTFDAGVPSAMPEKFMRALDRPQTAAKQIGEYAVSSTSMIG